MHRRMSLVVALLLLVVVFAGPGLVSAEPLSAQGKVAAASFDPLGWAWEWLTSLLADDLGSVVGGGEPTGGEGLSAIDGGAFIDPNGNS